MKKSKLLFAALLFAALFAFKALYPSTAEGIINKTKEVFSRDIDYAQVLGELGESIPVFSRKLEAARPDTVPQEQPQTVIQAVENEVAALSLAAEKAVSEGERSAAAVVEPPAAVAAFLASQEEYSDYALPENVSYEYLPYPNESAVPVAGYNSSGFGYRLHPIKGEVRFHYGTDFAAWTGEEILSFADGTVTYAGYCDSYGNYVTIDHGSGWESLYAHCSRLCVESGEKVSAGQCIALVGATGLVTGPHLHFELTKDGVYVNPEYYVN